jgi:hypothetical protein
MVSFISIRLKMEKPTLMRMFAITLDIMMVIITLFLRLVLGFDEYGENGDKLYLLYIGIVIICNSVQFILTKLVLLKSKISLITFALWVYLFGTIGSMILYCIECEITRRWTIDDMPRMLGLIEEVLTVFIFSCFNEIVNYLLLLYFIRKTLVTKASVYGIVGSIFIIFVSIFSGNI